MGNHYVYIIVYNCYRYEILSFRVRCSGGRVGRPSVPPSSSTSVLNEAQPYLHSGPLSPIFAEVLHAHRKRAQAARKLGRTDIYNVLENLRADPGTPSSRSASDRALTPKECAATGRGRPGDEKETYVA